MLWYYGFSMNKNDDKSCIIYILQICLRHRISIISHKHYNHIQRKLFGIVDCSLPLPFQFDAIVKNKLATEAGAFIWMQCLRSVPLASINISCMLLIEKRSLWFFLANINENIKLFHLNFKCLIISSSFMLIKWETKIEQTLKTKIQFLWEMFSQSLLSQFFSI